MNAAEIIGLSREHTLFSWSVQSAVDPIPMVQGEGVFYWDSDGKRYIDFSSQLINLNIGHQHPKVVQAIKDQADVLCFAQPSAVTEPRARLGQMLAEVAPGNLQKSFFCLGGAEANENAIKLARMYSGRRKILARYRSYHGATHGAIALTGDHRRWAAEPTIPGVIHVFDPYCYRCPFGWTPDTCHRECVTHVEDIIGFEGPENVAAIFLEGVTGTNGILVPPDDYWPRMRDLCDKYGILLVADEVMSGFGRTGTWFAVNHWDVVPDMITTAKGLTAGYVPLAAVIVSEPIAGYFEDKMLYCGLTYSAHPLSCAAGVATLQVYHDDGLIENAARLGAVLGEELEELKARHPSVGDVRYIGLFAAIELVKDRETKEPMPTASLAKPCRERGLSTFFPANLIFVAPPLCITETELRDGLSIIDEVLESADQSVLSG
jgi:taurine--2-oxoglutarate transaminase